MVAFKVSYRIKVRALLPNVASFVLFGIHSFISSWVLYAIFFKEIFSY